MLFFYAVVHGELFAELDTGGEELAEGHVLWFFAGAAGVVEQGPGVPEVVVLECVSTRKHEAGWTRREGTKRGRGRRPKKGEKEFRRGVKRLTWDLRIAP